MHVLCQLWLYLLNDVGSDTYIHRRSISCTTTPPIFDPAAKISPREIPLPIFSEGGLKIFNLELVDDIGCQHPLVLQAAYASVIESAAGFLSTQQMIPAQLHPAKDVFPEVILGGQCPSHRFVWVCCHYEISTINHLCLTEELLFTAVSQKLAAEVQAKLFGSLEAGVAAQRPGFTG